MIRRLTPVLFLVLFGVISASAEFAPPVRAVVQLSDQAAALARTQHVLPSDLSIFAPSKVDLAPVFYEPRDDSHRESWYRFGMNRWFTISVSGRTAEQIREQLKPSKNVLGVALDQPKQVSVEPNDISIHNMWGLYRMHCTAAWDIHHGESNIVITTIDTGCDIQHEDLAANIHVNPGEDLNHNGVWDESDNNGIDDDDNGFVDDLVGWDFVSISPDAITTPAVGEEYGPPDNLIYPDVHGHGTHVSGTAAAVTDNGIGVAAASWNVKLMPLRAGFAWITSNGYLQGSGYDVDFARAIQYAVDNGSRVISISFGGGMYTPFYQSAVYYTRENNVLIVAAAGNNDADIPTYPGAYDGVMCVAATGNSDIRASFSNFGTWVDIAAPGVNIYSTISNNSYHPYDYVSWQGTSMATPNVASVAGLMLNYDSTLTDDDLEQTLLATADSIDDVNAGYAGMLGAGRVDAQAALESLESDSLPHPIDLEASLPVHSNLASLTWNFSDQGRDDFLDFRIERNRTVIDSTTDTTFVDTLTLGGRYIYGVTARFTGGDSRTVYAEVRYNPAVGIPYADDFENDLSGWRISGLTATPASLTPWPTFDGTQAVNTSSDNNQLSGIFRDFAPVQGIAVDGWTNLLVFPSPSLGLAGALVIADPLTYLECGLNSDGHLTSYWTTEEETVVLDAENDLATDSWYQYRLRYLDGFYHLMLLDSDHSVLFDQVLEAPDIDVSSVAFGTINQPGGWSTFDAVSLHEWTGVDATHFTPVDLTTNPYALVITGATLDENELTAGDEIGVFDGDVCVGAATVNTTWPLVMTAWGADSTMTGFAVDDTMSFRVWNHSTGSETALAPSFEEGTGVFGYGHFSRFGLTGSTSGVDENVGLPKTFAVGAAYPNPFNPTSTVQLSLPRAGNVGIAVYNLLGQAVYRETRHLTAGRHAFVFNADRNGDALSSGIYFLRVQYAGQVQTRKLMLMK